MSNCLFYTYKYSVMSYGNHMFQTKYDMSMATMCAYPSSHYALPN